MRYNKIKDYPNYSVSDTGEILNELTGAKLRGTINKDGYRAVCLTSEHKKSVILVHRLVGFAFCGGYTDGLVINHKNADKLDNRAENLEWVTHRENFDHSVKLGLNKPKRERKIRYRTKPWHKNAKLTEADTEKIRDMYWDQGLGCGKIAKMFGVDRKKMKMIVNYDAYLPFPPSCDWFSITS